jgi:hypothetical protein
VDMAAEHENTPLRRRTFIRLMGGSLVAASSSFLYSPKLARASDSPVFGLIGQALEFMKRSGDMELELNAQNLKLEQILRNQQALFAALQAMNETLNDVQNYIVEIPSETISLNQVIDAQTRFKSVADNISVLRRRPRDKQALAFLQADRDKLYDLSNDLFAAVGATTRPPGFVIAANHLVNAGILLNRHEASLLKSRNTATDAERFKAFAFNVMSTLQTMTGETGIQSRFALLHEKLERRKAEVTSLPFSRLLPKDFDRSVEEGKQRQTVPASICLMTGVSETLLRTMTGQPLGSNTYIHDFSQTRQLRKVQYDVTSLGAFGGRRAFEVTMKPEQTWSSDSWSRVIRRFNIVSELELSGEPSAKYSGCTEIGDSAKGAPAAFRTFEGYLRAYSALVALEGRLLALQRVGQDDLKRITSLYDRLDRSR